ncbi:MAG: hypothetical protein II611_11295, partial [Treponema sp.]|nr:hypothetical protein [Treponema sp.]
MSTFHYAAYITKSAFSGRKYKISTAFFPFFYSKAQCAQCQMQSSKNRTITTVLKIEILLHNCEKYSIVIEETCGKENERKEIYKEYK